MLNNACGVRIEGSHVVSAQNVVNNTNVYNTFVQPEITAKGELDYSTCLYMQ